VFGYLEIIWIVVLNLGLMMFEGMNIYVVDGYVIDLGLNDVEYLEWVWVVVGGEIMGVLLIYGYFDYVDGIDVLVVELFWGRVIGELEMEVLCRVFEMGSIDVSVDFFVYSERMLMVIVEIGLFFLVVIFGYVVDYVSFVFGDVCFCGDLIFGYGLLIVLFVVGGGFFIVYMSLLSALNVFDFDLFVLGYGFLDY